MMTSELMLNLARDRQRDLVAEAANARLVASGRRNRQAKKRARVRDGATRGFAGRVARSGTRVARWGR
jgi:hypothetical protein